LLGQRGELVGQLLRIERTSTALDGIDDEGVGFLVRNGDAVGVTTDRTTTRINVCLVGNVRARRQLEQTVAVNGPLDQRIVEEASNVVSELGEPLAAGGGRVGRPPAARRWRRRQACH
jgi:hypothetical protein